MAKHKIGDVMTLQELLDTPIGTPVHLHLHNNDGRVYANEVLPYTGFYKPGQKVVYVNGAYELEIEDLKPTDKLLNIETSWGGSYTVKKLK